MRTRTVERRQFAAAMWVTTVPLLAAGLVLWAPVYVWLPPQMLAVVLLPTVRWPTVTDPDPRGTFATLVRDPVIRVMASAAGVSAGPWLLCRRVAWAIGAVLFVLGAVLRT